jgi:predicted small metal-binding protein
MCKYCLECDWQATADEGYTKAEVSKRAIEHFVKTGHAVDSLQVPSEPVRKN